MTDKKIKLESFMKQWVLEENVFLTEMNLAALKDLIDFLVSETHDKAHAFTENPNLPGTCIKCAWVEKDIQVEDYDCEDDLRTHLITFLQFVEDLQQEAAAEAAFRKKIEGMFVGRARIFFID